MKIQEIPISDIQPYGKNAKKHPEKQVKQIADSIKEFGFNQPIVVDKDNVIIVGHGRYMAAQYLEFENVPVMVADINEEQARAYRLADNKLNESEWEMDLVIEELKLLPLPTLDLTGFSQDLIVSLNPEKDDAVPEKPKKPKSKLGDIYEIGGHRVMCGDSTKIEDVEKLMDGKKADMVHTDPPYNVDYGASKKTRHKKGKIENDKMSGGDWEVFCKDIYAVFQQFNKGDIYMWGAPGPEGMRMRLWLVELGCHWSATIVWKKDRLVLSPENYQRLYEPCFYGWFNKSSFNGDRKQVEVWDTKRPSDSKLHPTMKPVELCSKAILNSSIDGGIVLDIFLGSGSTLIACEKTNRSCYGMELDPKYIDVIIQRWVDFTGNRDIKKNGEKMVW